MFLRGKHGLALVCAAFWAGCSVFSSSSDDNNASPGQPDAGPDALAPVTGTALGNYDLTVDLANVRHGVPAIAKITVARTRPFHRTIRVDLKDPPAGVTADLVELGPDATSGELKITADATVPQGPLTLTVRANVPQTTLLDLTIPKDVAIQGAPGELDTSFGDKGVFAAANEGTSHIFLRGDGSFLLGGGTGRNQGRVSAYSGSPLALDPTFASGGSLAFPFESLALAASGNHVVVAGMFLAISPQVVYSARITSVLVNGATGVDPGYATHPDYELRPLGLALRDDGAAAVLGRPAAVPSAGWRVDWLTASGAPDTAVSSSTTSAGTAPTGLVAGAYVTNALLAVGGDVAIRIRVPGGNLDSLWGESGTVQFPDAPSLSSAVMDSKGGLLVGGVAGSGLYLARANTKLDTAFGTNGTARVSLPATTLSGGRIAVQSDGSIIQIGSSADANGSHCVAARYSAAGVLDPTFGTAGIASLPVPDCTAQDLVIDSKGKLWIGGPKVVRVWL